MAEGGRGVSEGALIQRAATENISEERVRALLKRLSEGGEVYRPQPGFYRLTSEERVG
jgi:DNA-binding transcriptional regulator PaaX